MRLPFEIKFNNVVEIRMGSPYHSCNIELNGITDIVIPLAEWQDKYAWSSDYTKLALIKWNFENNQAGFNIYLIELATNRTEESPKILGLLNNLFFIDNRIHFNKFLYNKEKSLHGKLCCNIDEEYHFFTTVSP
jgi:hypothetical protein